MNFEEVLLSDDIVNSINNNIDYLLEIIPELKYMIGFDHKNPHHHLDVWNHTLLALSMSEKNIDVRLSLLLHDIGKPFSYQVDGNIRHFRNHPIESEKISRTILSRLGYNEEYIDRICYLVLNHDNPITKEDIENNYELEKTRFNIQICDTRSHNPVELDIRNKYVYSIEKLFEEEYLKYGKILGAALLNDNKIYYTLNGSHSSLFTLEKIGALRKAKQGFICENGYFVDRILGLDIANYFNQIDYKHFPYYELFSEDIKKEGNKLVKKLNNYQYISDK